MAKTDFQQLYKRLQLIAVFRGVLQNPAFAFLADYCRANIEEKPSKYAALVSALYERGGNLTTVIQTAVFEDENVYVKAAAKGQTCTQNIVDAADEELRLFSEIAALTAKDFALDMGLSISEIPKFDSFIADMGALYHERLGHLDKFGYGIFSAKPMFRLTDEKELQPIVSADETRMGQFIGYELQRGEVLQNTLAFLEGRPAANTLLCGDAGTGKSSTVKALANEFFTRGLRLIELRKDQLRYLPFVMGKISGNPLKFIIFIDDLSFNKNNDDFSMLKAALEGSASATAENAVIYATSNRRHIVKESFGEREGDDVHRNDTLQETLSLSDRFGLTVLFSKPDKTLYLKIVKELAKRFGVCIDERDLEVKAEAFAIKKGSRSARGAEQFVKGLLSQKQ